MSSRECTPRTCGVILNIINCLLDLNVIEKKSDANNNQEDKNGENRMVMACPEFGSLRGSSNS